MSDKDEKRKARMPVNHGRSHEQSQSGHSFFTATHDIETLAEEQGVSPITDFDQLLGDFWPEDESIEDFVATLREWRCEAGVGGREDTEGKDTRRAG
jgi:hypothetical protein